jgi:hypothetical protein
MLGHGSIKLEAELVPDTEMIEYVCAENEKDRQHMVGKTSDRAEKQQAVKVAPEVLGRYAGSYECSCTPENPVDVVRYTITASGGQLFWNGEPMIPLSETVFVAARGSRIEFFTDNEGVVSFFTMQFTEGEMKAIRKRDGK